MSSSCFNAASLSFGTIPLSPPSFELERIGSSEVESVVVEEEEDIPGNVGKLLDPFDPFDPKPAKSYMSSSSSVMGCSKTTSLVLYSLSNCSSEYSWLSSGEMIDASVVLVAEGDVTVDSFCSWLSIFSAFSMLSMVSMVSMFSCSDRR